MNKISFGQLFCEIVQKLVDLDKSSGKKKAQNVGSEQEAMWILESVLQQNKAQILLNFHLQVDKKTIAKVDKFLVSRLEGVPLGYVLKSAQFGPLNLFVNKNVLIPRIETELWCQWLIDLIRLKAQNIGKEPDLILDLCTGSGAIGLLLAKELSKTKIIGSDICPKALAVARKNKKLLGAQNMQFYQSDLFENLKRFSSGKLDIICSNPPYICPNKHKNLNFSVRHYEPEKALVARDKGMEFYNKILLQSARFLNSKNGFGWLVFEYDQYTCDKVCKSAEQNGFRVKHKFTDLFGKPRAVVLERF